MRPQSTNEPLDLSVEQLKNLSLRSYRSIGHIADQFEDIVILAIFIVCSFGVIGIVQSDLQTI